MTTTITPLATRRARLVTQPPAAGARAATRHAALRWAFWLSGLLAGVAGVAATLGVVHPDIFRDPAMTAGNARGTALVVLVVALPSLLLGMCLARRGSWRGQIVWMGALGYLLYNHVLFTFATAFNPLFLLYVASLGLALWALVALLIATDAGELRAQVAPGMPVRVLAGYLLTCALVFGAAWLSDIVPALLDGTTPASLDKTIMLTSPIEVMDLSATLPLCALAAVWLWRRHSWGYLLAGVLVSMLTIETASIAIDQYFGHRADPSQSLGAVPLMAVLTVLGLALTSVYLRQLLPKPDAERSQL
jgi:hypothetical protein